MIKTFTDKPNKQGRLEKAMLKWVHEQQKSYSSRFVFQGVEYNLDEKNQLMTATVSYSERGFS